MIENAVLREEFPLKPARFAGDLVREIPRLRRYARMLCRDATLADDLVQDALETALRRQGDFALGTNLSAWLYTILRHLWLNHARKARRRSAAEPAFALVSAERDRVAEQETGLYWRDVADILGALNTDAVETFMLVVVDGFSYEEAARVVEAPVGTVRSRIARVRARLRDVLFAEQSERA